MIFLEFSLGCIALALFVAALWRYPVAVAIGAVAVGSFFDVMGVSAASRPNGAPLLQVGVSLYLLDLVCFVLVACSARILLRSRTLKRDLCWWAVLLLGLGVLNFARGAQLIGPKAPGNAARDLIYLVLPAACFSCMSTAVRMTAERIVKYLSVAALVLTGIAVARWTGLIPVPEGTDDGLRDFARVLSAAYAMIIGQGLIALSGIQLLNGFRAWGLIIAGILTAALFALQHRSVWTATTAGMLWLVFRSPRVVRREWLKFSSMVLFAASALALGPLVASGFVETAIGLAHSNIVEIQNDNSTWDWRVHGYTEAIERILSSGPANLVLGPPSGLDRIDATEDASIFIHDQYVAVFAYYGAVGCALLLAWLLVLAARIRGSSLLAGTDRNAQVSSVILEALLVSTLIYFIPYAAGQLEGSLLGLLWLATSGHQTQAATVDANRPRTWDRVDPLEPASVLSPPQHYDRVI